MQAYIILGIGFLAFFMAAVFKGLLYLFVGKKKDWLKLSLSNGGMPSLHSAFMSAVVCSIFFNEGASSTFALGCAVMLIVFSDAVRVRQNVGLQGFALNKALHKLHMHPVKIVLGHTPTQVAAGFLIGFICAFAFSFMF